MPITIKAKGLQSIAKHSHPTDVDKVIDAVSTAQATGEDPYLAAVYAKTTLLADQEVVNGPTATVAGFDDTPPWEHPTPNADDPQEALRDFEDMKKLGRLFLVSKETKNEYEVVEYDSESRKAKLLSPSGLSLTPTLGNRETSNYFPVWRKG